MKKILIFSVLICCFIAVFVSCSDDGNVNANINNGSDTNVTTAATTPSETSGTLSSTTASHTTETPSQTTASVTTTNVVVTGKDPGVGDIFG